MNKLPIPAASYAAAVPVLRPDSYGPRSEIAGRLGEALEGQPRRAFDRDSLRRAPDLALEPPSRGPRGDDGVRSSGPRGVHSPSYGASAGFLAQLIGQAVQLGDSLGTAAPDATDLASAAYRKAADEPLIAVPSGGHLNLAV